MQWPKTLAKRGVRGAAAFFSQHDGGVDFRARRDKCIALPTGMSCVAGDDVAEGELRYLTEEYWLLRRPDSR